MRPDSIVIGGGVVGAALAFGLLRKGQSVVVLDGQDRDLRAARANFGLVWTQGKGANFPAYNVLTRQSADLWPNFLKDLSDLSGVNIDYSRRGGLVFCLGRSEFETRSALNNRIHAQHGEPFSRMVERPELERLLPAARLGPDVVGASYCESDGHVNPLQLLAALHRAIQVLGGKILYRNPAVSITPSGDGFTVCAADATFRADQVIVAAGMATSSLTAPLGLDLPIRSERGQLLVLERVQPLLPFPASGLRQTSEGTIMIGATKESTIDRGVTVGSGAKLASRATRILPALASIKVVRQWSGFRILPPDGAPVYAQSTRYPGLFSAICHSGVTLAASHAFGIAPAMAEGRLEEDFPAFSNGRFDVQKCA